MIVAERGEGDKHTHLVIFIQLSINIILSLIRWFFKNVYLLKAKESILLGIYLSSSQSRRTRWHTIKTLVVVYFLYICILYIYVYCIYMKYIYEGKTFMWMRTWKDMKEGEYTSHDKYPFYLISITIVYLCFPGKIILAITYLF